jgi:hypothetical protein
VHYPWHPAVGRHVTVAYREHRAGEPVAVCEMADGTRAVLPAWMLDRTACAHLTLGPPRPSIEALLDLAK